MTKRKNFTQMALFSDSSESRTDGRYRDQRPSSKVPCMGIKRSYLNKLMMQKEIPYYKPHGKLCFFDVEDLDNWLRRVRISSNEEIEQKVQNKRINL